jgi:hypothetical protein
VKIVKIIDLVLLKLFDHVDIVKEIGGEKVIYLRRYFLFTSKRFNIYLHHIRRSDDDPDPHDHPWDFTTFLIRGVYINEGYRQCAAQWPCLHPNFTHVRWYAKRKAEHIHQVKLIDGPVWSLVFTGPYRREWNFVTRDGPVMWRKYLGITDGNPFDKVTQ